MIAKRHFSTWRRGMINASTCVLFGSLLLGGALIGRGLVTSPGRQATSAGPAAEMSSAQHPTWTHEVISEVKVGERVVTPDTSPDANMGTSVDSATWKLLNLVVDIPSKDGAPRDTANIQTLQSPQWIEENHAAPGAQVPTPLDLQEMGMQQETATVISIEPCPPIKPGPGRVVLTTVNHLNQFLFNLTVVDAQGRRETIGVTGWHKIFSETRDHWVSASELQLGEKLRGHDGSVTVTTLVRTSGTFRVYNLTVEREHVYYASGEDVLAHNTWCDGVHHVLPKVLGGNDLSLMAGKLQGAIHEELHQLLNQELKKAGFPLGAMGGRGNSARAWATYLTNNPGKQKIAFDIVLQVSKTIDQKFGTTIAADVVAAIKKQAYRPYP